MSNEKIYVTKEGYNAYLKKLEEAERVYADHLKTRADYGLNSHDDYRTGAFDEKKDSILYNIKELKETIKKLSIIEDKNIQEDTVNMGDIVDIQFEDQEVQRIQIVGGEPDVERDDGLICITINSPLGNAVYKKKIGEQVSYKVNGTDFKINILSKENVSEDENGLE